MRFHVIHVLTIEANSMTSFSAFLTVLEPYLIIYNISEHVYNGRVPIIIPRYACSQRYSWDPFFHKLCWAATTFVHSISSSTVLPNRNTWKNNVWQHFSPNMLKAVKTRFSMAHLLNLPICNIHLRPCENASRKHPRQYNNAPRKHLSSDKNESLWNQTRTFWPGNLMPLQSSVFFVHLECPIF